MPNNRATDDKELVDKILYHRLELKETTYVIGEVLGVSRKRVERILKELGYGGNINKNKLFPYKDEILSEYDSRTVNATYLAKKYNVTVSTMLSFLRNNDRIILSIAMGSEPRTKAQLSQSDIEDIITAYSEMSFTEIVSKSKICNQFNISLKTLKEVLEENGIASSKVIEKSTRCKNINHSLRASWRPGEEFFMQFRDFDKINLYNKLLNTASHRHSNKDLLKMNETFNYKETILKFYYDPQANFFFDYWRKNDYIDYLKPSIDHIQPISKGGDWKVENLQIIPKCFNYLKSTMTGPEWSRFIKDGIFQTCIENLDLMKQSE